MCWPWQTDVDGTTERTRGHYGMKNKCGGASISCPVTPDLGGSKTAFRDNSPFGTMISHKNTVHKLGVLFPSA